MAKIIRFKSIGAGRRLTRHGQILFFEDPFGAWNTPEEISIFGAVALLQSENAAIVTWPRVDDLVGSQEPDFGNSIFNPYLWGVDESRLEPEERETIEQIIDAVRKRQARAA